MVRATLKKKCLKSGIWMTMHDPIPDVLLSLRDQSPLDWETSPGRPTRRHADAPQNTCVCLIVLKQVILDTSSIQYPMSAYSTLYLLYRDSACCIERVSERVSHAYFGGSRGTTCKDHVPPFRHHRCSFTWSTRSLRISEGLV